MFSLVWRLLPYLLVLGGLAILAVTIPVIKSGGETSPTEVALADITVDASQARWLKLTGGGLYLQDALVDEEVKKSTGARKVKAWFVPYIDEKESIDRALADAGSTTRPVPKKLVLVQYSPDEFLRSFGAIEDLKPSDKYRAVSVTGLRSSNLIFPQRMKDYIRAELHLPLEGVVVVKFGDEPMQRDAAIQFAAVAGALALIGLIWVIMRWRRRPGPPPLPAAV